jgi:hypothetical protein
MGGGVKKAWDKRSGEKKEEGGLHTEGERASTQRRLLREDQDTTGGEEPSPPLAPPSPLTIRFPGLI